MEKFEIIYSCPLDIASKTSLPAVYVVVRSLEALEGEVDEEDSLRLALFTPLLAPMAWVDCIQAVVLDFKKWDRTGSEVGKWKSH